MGKTYSKVFDGSKNKGPSR